MSEWEPEQFEDESVLDAADTLDSDDLSEDALDAGVIPPDRWSPAMKYGTTETEESEGESMDQLLAEEEPDIDPYAEPDPEDPEDTDDIEQDPRAGRLVAEDEGAHSVAEPDLVARDVGVDSGAAGAEEAAVHVIGEPDDGTA